MADADSELLEDLDDYEEVDNEKTFDVCVGTDDLGELLNLRS